MRLEAPHPQRSPSHHDVGTWDRAPIGSNDAAAPGSEAIAAKCGIRLGSHGANGAGEGSAGKDGRGRGGRRGG